LSGLGIPVIERRLDNGLRVVLSPDHTVPVVAVNLWYGVGSRNEVAGQTGFAHLFEHMMFQGSAHVPKNRHFELVERAGGTLNATTWFDRTNYFDTLPSHHLDLALWLESDRMGWMVPALTEETLRNQQAVVMEEKKQRYDNRPYGDWDERLQRLVYPPSHPYHHKVIGSMEDIGAATLEDVRSFFQTYYTPSNAVLTVCGDFDPEDALSRVERFFGEIPSGDPPPPIPGPTELPDTIGTTVRDLVHDDVPLPRIYMAGRIPVYSDPGFHAAQLGMSILGEGRASRLFRNLVRGKGVAKDAGTHAFPLMTGAGMYVAWATGFQDSRHEALTDHLVREMEDLTSATDDELDRVKALASTRMLHSIEDVSERADLLSMFACLFGTAEQLNDELERLMAVSVDDVRRFAESYLGDDNRALVIYEPEAEDEKAA
jgi:predicted Zn-dependent peptidase